MHSKDRSRWPTVRRMERNQRLSDLDKECLEIFGLRPGSSGFGCALDSRQPMRRGGVTYDVYIWAFVLVLLWCWWSFYLSWAVFKKSLDQPSLFALPPNSFSGQAPYLQALSLPFSNALPHPLSSLLVVEHNPRARQHQLTFLPVFFVRPFLLLSLALWVQELTIVILHIQLMQPMSTQFNMSPTSPTMRKRLRTDLAGNSGTDSHPPPLPGPVGEDAFINDDAANESGGDDDDDEEKPKSDKKAGRRKIKIEFIQDKSRRHITFSKRKAGKFADWVTRLVRMRFSHAYFQVSWKR